MTRPTHPDPPPSHSPPRYPAIGLVRATESAALAAGRWMGKGEPEAVVRAAQDAMAEALNYMHMQGRIVSGGKIHEGGDATLGRDTQVGKGIGPELDVVADIIDGSDLVAQGMTGAMSAAAIAPPGAMWYPAPARYMQKLVVDRKVAEALGPEALDAPPAWTLGLISRQKDKPINDLVVFIEDKPRHESLIRDVRRAGARVHLRTSGDVGGALMAAEPNCCVDALMGIGGASEGLISACAVKILGGGMLCRVAPQSQAESDACNDAGIDVQQVLTADDMVRSDVIVFSATGVTDSPLLNGVRYHGDIVDTHSLVLRSETGTRRLIHTEHVFK